MSRIHRELDDATAAAIVRATQKDEFYLDNLARKMTLLLSNLSPHSRNQLDPQLIKGLTKLLYFLITTGLGAKTLGEQYVDLHYVNDGKRVKSWKRLAFALIYSLGPLIGGKVISLVGKRLPKYQGLLNVLSTDVLIDVQNFHLAIFYLKGRYYSITKRFLGLKYGIGYKLPPGQSSNEYELLGGLIMLQLFIKYTSHIKKLFLKGSGSDDDGKEEAKFKSQLGKGEVVGSFNLTKLELDDHDTVINLEDETKLPYIPANNRNCMLCLEFMKDPSCGACGHIFCWGCILDWCNERTECPLCRSPLKVNEIIPLR